MNDLLILRCLTIRSDPGQFSGLVIVMKENVLEYRVSILIAPSTALQ